MSHSISKPFSTIELIKFTLPSIIMMMFISVYSVVNGIFVANYVGENALAAVTIVFPLISILLAISIMFASGANAIISANLGAGRPDVARENFTRLVIIAIIIGVIIGAISFIFRYEIVVMLGATSELKELSATYLMVYSVGFPFFFLQIFCQYFFATVGKPIYSMISFMVSGIINMTMAYFAMAVMEIGIVGAAIGPMISVTLPSIVFLLFFGFNKTHSLYFVKPKVHEYFMLKTCLNGSSELVINLASAVTTVIFNKIMLSLVGEAGVAAVAISIQVQFLFNSLFIGFVAGVSPIIGYAYGAKNYKRIKSVLGSSLKLVGISSAVISAIAFIMSSNIVGFYLEEGGEAYDIALAGFRIFAIVFIFAGTNIFGSGFFTALSNGKVSAAISFLRTFIFIIGMLILLPPILGVTGVWLAIPIAESLSFIIVIALLLKNRKKYHY